MFNQCRCPIELCGTLGNDSERPVHDIFGEDLGDHNDPLIGALAIFGQDAQLGCHQSHLNLELAFHPTRARLVGLHCTPWSDLDLL